MRNNSKQLLNYVKNNDGNKKIVGIVAILLVFSMLLLLVSDRGTVALSENVDELTITCPEKARIGEEIECSVVLNSVTFSTQGINANHSFNEGIEFVDFILDDIWNEYINDGDGFVLVNLDGVKGTNSVGNVKYKIPETAKPSSIYKVGLVNASIGDGEDAIVNFDSVYDEIRIISDVNTLDNIILTGATLNETFDKNKTEYTGTSSADKLTIDVVKTDEYSKVSGDIGEKDIHYGVNNFSIVVTGEDGNVKTYTLEIYKEYKFSSEKYVYNEENNYLYVGSDKNNNTILSNIDVPDGLSKNIEDNKLIISYQEEILKEINLIIISSDNYDLSKKYIYLGLEKFDINKITFVNCDDYLIDNKLQLKYNDVVVDEFDILSVDLGELIINDNVITLEDIVSYDDFVSNISLTGNLTYEVLNGVEEVNAGNITDGMELKIKYNDEVIDSYNILIYKLSFGEDLIIDETNSYIKYKKQGSSVEEFLTNVSIVGNAKAIVTDTNNNEKSVDTLLATGDKLVIYLGSQKIEEYIIAVSGDANGDGRVSLLDLSQIRKHIAGSIDQNTGEIYEKQGIYFVAIDISGDGKISLIDLSKMRKLIVGSDIDE